MLRWAFLTLPLYVLTACSLSGAIGRNSVDYNQAIEYATNNMMATNFLRARDQIPLYFTDLSQIRGSLQFGTNAAVSVPFGNPDLANQRTRNIATGAISISTSPTFDIAPLNDTIFTEGLLKPIDPSLLGDYLTEGLPQTLLFRLFVERIEFVMIPASSAEGSTAVVCGYENTAFMANVVQAAASASPGSASAPASPCPPAGFPTNLTFDQLLPQLPLIVHNYTRLTPFGPPFRVEGAVRINDLLRAEMPPGCASCSSGPGGKSGGSGESSYSLLPAHGRPGEYQLYKSSPAVAICIPTIINGLTKFLATETEEACFADRILQGEQDQGSWKVHIYFRSAQAIFEYLGAVLRIERLNETRAAKGQPPLALPAGLNFYVSAGYDPSARVNLTYDGRLYHIRDSSPSDNTLRIMSILNQLLNTLKSASEIPTTKAVEAVP